MARIVELQGFNELSEYYAFIAGLFVLRLHTIIHSGNSFVLYIFASFSLYYICSEFDYHASGEFAFCAKALTLYRWCRYELEPFPSGHLKACRPFLLFLRMN